MLAGVQSGSEAPATAEILHTTLGRSGEPSHRRRPRSEVGRRPVERQAGVAERHRHRRPPGGDLVEHVELLVSPTQLDRQVQLGRRQSIAGGDLADDEVRRRLPVPDAAEPRVCGVPSQDIRRVRASEQAATDDRFRCSVLGRHRLEPSRLGRRVVDRVGAVHVHGSGESDCPRLRGGTLAGCSAARRARRSPPNA